MKIRVMILLAALCMVITSTKAANDKETKKQYEKALVAVLQEYNKQFAKVAKDSVISIRLFVEGNNVVYQTKCDEDDVDISDMESDSLTLKKILLNESLSDVLINADKGLIVRFIGNKSGKIANIHITPQEVIEFKERYAQTDSVAVAQKQAEQFAKQADENPNDGKLQYNAGMAFVNEEMKDKKDYALAQQYLERALKIAEEQTVMKDTLMGLTCQGLAIVYMGKNDPEKFATYLGKSVDAFEKELGKYDPLTIGSKLIGSWLMMRSNAFLSYSNILEAFVNNDNAPENMRIENMNEANIILELSTEMFIAYITERFRYALPMVYYKGKGCLIVQSADWNIERPLVGWMVPDMLRTDEERSTHKRDQALLYDGEKIIALSEEERNQNMLQVSFNHFVKNPRKLVGKEGDSRIYFLSPEEYGKILYAYRVYKAGTK